MAKKARPKISLPSFAVEFDREVDGRRISETPKLLGVMAYGVTTPEVLHRVYAISSIQR